MSKHKVILYGANGYTGKLIIDEALKQGLNNILLVGRNEKSIGDLAHSTHLDFAISTASEIDTVLKKEKEAVLLVNAAGPFIETAKPIAQACINNGVHYIDVTGEISVFQQLLHLDKEAKKSGVMLLPGAGFDVVPTDCLALHLKENMPEANQLALAFAGLGGGLSRGTARTAISQMDSHTWHRENGEIKPIPWRKYERKINFGPFAATCLPIPWGDLQTAFVSTQIPNIAVYVPFAKKARRMIPFLTKLIQFKPVKSLAMSYVSKKIKGPDTAAREGGQTHIIGIAKGPGEQTIKKHLVTPDGYTFTALSCVLIIKKVLAGKIKPGYMTPSMAYGSKFVEEIKGVSWLNR